jgi:hypothetical protein
MSLQKSSSSFVNARDFSYLQKWREDPNLIARIVSISATPRITASYKTQTL